MEDCWRDHLNNMTCDSVISARNAVLYYLGEQECLMEEHLDRDHGGIKDWRNRGVEVLTTNITEMIIDRSALTYDEQPQRKVLVNGDEDKTATERYKEILEIGQFEPVSDRADSFSRLLGLSLVLVQAFENEETGEQELSFIILHRGNCDFKVDEKTGSIESLIYLNSLPGNNGGKLYTLWDKKCVTDIEWEGDSHTGTGRVQKVDPNTYGMVPVALLWDKAQPKGSCFPKNRWESLIAMNRRYNMFHTETGFNCTFQCYGAFFTNAEVQDDLVIGPDAIVPLGNTANGDPVFAEYRTPDINIDKFLQWMELYSSSIAEHYSVKVRMAGEGTATSGFQLVVEEIPSLQSRNDRIKAAKQFEKDLYNVISRISKVVNLGLPEKSNLDVIFQDPKLPVDEVEQWNITKEKIATEYIPIEDAWLRENPDMTPEQIQERKERIRQSKVVNTPTFGGIVDGEQ